MAPKICVLGAGIVGLTSAVCIQDAVPGANVTLVSEAFSPHTTSDGSAGFWLPFLVNQDQAQQIDEWGKATYQYLKDIALSEHANRIGVSLVSGYIFSVKDPPWKHYVLGYKVMTDEEMKMFPDKKNGVFCTTMTVDVHKYLTFLLNRFKTNGGKVLQKNIQSLHELDGQYDVLVNCCGLGARQLVNDSSITPTRGQTIRVEAPWIKHFYFDVAPNDMSNFTYILTCSDYIVLGGTAQKGDWNTSIDHKDREGILHRCTKLVPSLKDAKIIQEWTGLRPSRPLVRVEVEQHKPYSSKVVHNYGHGGAGISICWGCAVDTTKLVLGLIRTSQSKL